MAQRYPETWGGFQVGMGIVRRRDQKNRLTRMRSLLQSLHSWEKHNWNISVSEHMNGTEDRSNCEVFQKA